VDGILASAEPVAGQQFPRSLRLLAGREFQHVFARARRIPGSRLMVLYRAQEPAGAEPRLGLAISRKHARRAVDRNRVKRAAREAFRLRRAGLPPVDIIVLSRVGVADLDAREARAELDRLLEKVK
jgi:ribonuclease P protein component